jgi:hypothetical protein
LRQGVDSATLALYQSGIFDMHSRVRVENGSGTPIDLFGRYFDYLWKLPNPNEPIGSLTVSFVRETTADNLTTSLAPTVVSSSFNKLDNGTSYSPLLQLGRIVTLDIALTVVGGARPAGGSTLWYRVFDGYITNVDWPEHESRTASITCNGLAGILQIAKSEDSYVYTAGSTLETIAQQILTNNGFGSIPITFTEPTNKTIPVDYGPGLQKTIWSQIWDLAQSMGWIVTYRYFNRTTPTLTFYPPAREKVSTDMTVTAWDYQALSIDEREVRNVGYMAFWNSQGQDQLIGGPPDFENEQSIIKYGGSKMIRRPFWIRLEQDSPIRRQEDAEDMLAAALSDVSDPDAIASVITFPLIFAESGVDRYLFPAKQRLFDSAQNFAPFAVSVHVTADEQPYSVVDVRGVPTAGARTWRTISQPRPIGFGAAEEVRIIHNEFRYYPLYSGMEVLALRTTIEVPPSAKGIKQIIKPHPNGVDEALVFDRAVFQNERDSGVKIFWAGYDILIEPYIFARDDVAYLNTIEAYTDYVAAGPPAGGMATGALIDSSTSEIIALGNMVAPVEPLHPATKEWVEDLFSGGGMPGPPWDLTEGAIAPAQPVEL